MAYPEWLLNTIVLCPQDYIYEELIHQHPDISYIYPGSVNTLRVDTVKDDNGLVISNLRHTEDGRRRELRR
jgi:hypothetical protein